MNDRYIEGSELIPDTSDLHTWPEQGLALGLTKRRQKSLISQNDDKGKTFPEIAAWIRKHILKEKGKKA